MYKRQLPTFNEDKDGGDLFTEEGYLLHRRRHQAAVLVQSIWRGRYDILTCTIYAVFDTVVTY